MKTESSQLRSFERTACAADPFKGALHALRLSPRTTNQLFVGKTSVCFVMKHNCAGRHVPERAFNCIEDADALNSYAEAY